MKALILCLIVTPAISGDLAVWGTSTAALQPCVEATACLTVINHLDAAPDEYNTILTLDGLQVEVRVSMRPGDLPDHIEVRAPTGWLVLPSAADVPEGAAVVFRLFEPQVSEVYPRIFPPTAMRATSPAGLSGRGFSHTSAPVPAFIEVTI